MGDGIMVEFGAPIRYEKHALLAVTSAWKMQAHMHTSKYPFKLRVGIATGVATTGIIGSKRQSFTAFGDTVNLASRIEGLCEPGEVTVDEATYNDCKDIVEFGPVTRLASYTQSDNVTLVERIRASLTKIETVPKDVALSPRVGKA